MSINYRITIVIVTMISTRDGRARGMHDSITMMDNNSVHFVIVVVIVVEIGVVIVVEIGVGVGVGVAWA
mgnify:FL=1